jgi:hypothetical protein
MNNWRKIYRANNNNKLIAKGPLCIHIKLKIISERLEKEGKRGAALP